MTELSSESEGTSYSIDSANLGTASSTLRGQTTVMLKNIPAKYTQRMLLRELLAAGFQGKMDFMHLPIDPCTGNSRGFAFCNLTTAEAAELFYCIFQRRFLKCHSAEIPLEVMAAEVQGFEANATCYFEVKASRKEQGLDTRTGCPVFLRPPPGHLLASVRDFEQPERPRTGSTGKGLAEAPGPAAPPVAGLLGTGCSHSASPR
eukprot:Skav224453  [mRNA]  locus=scaffold3438:39234:39845:+ [translate_table: standard]